MRSNFPIFMVDFMADKCKWGKISWKNWIDEIFESIYLHRIRLLSRLTFFTRILLHASRTRYLELAIYYHSR